MARTLCTILCLSVALAIAPRAIAAENGLLFAEGFESPAVDGTIWSMLEFHGELIVGGRFDRIGREEISTLAAWDGSSWRSMGLDGSGLRRVYCMEIHEGELYIGTARNWTTEEYRVFRRAGDSWIQVGGDLSAPPRALEVHDGNLFVGLGQSIISRGERPLYELIGDSWLNASFPSGETFASVHALLSVGDALYVGGYFAELGSVGNARGIYEWKTRHWTLVGDGLQSQGSELSVVLPQGQQGVHALAYYDGMVHAAGSFLNNSTGLAGLARWTGSAWEALPSIGVGWNLTVSPQGLVATGLLANDTGGGVYEYFLGAWDGSSWNELDPATSSNPMTTCTALFDGELALARDGVLDAGPWAGHLPHGPTLSLWDGSTWTNPIGGDSPGGEVYSILEYGGELVVGGLFEFAGAIGAPGIARYDGSDWHSFGKGLLPDIEDAFYGGGIRDVVEYGGSLVAAGRFFAPGEDQVSGVAFWNGSAWGSLTPGHSGGSTDGAVYDLTVYDGDLYALGRFSELNGRSANGIARFDGVAWEALAASDGARDIRAAAVFQDELVIGGDFDAVDGVSANGLARFDGQSWNNVAPLSFPELSDLAVFDGKLYIARAPDLQPGPGSSNLWVWTGLGSPVAVVDANAPSYFLEHAVSELFADSTELHLIAYELSQFVRSIHSWDGAELTPLDISGEDLQSLYSGFPRVLGQVGESVYVGGRWKPDAAAGPQHLARLSRKTEVATASIRLDARMDARGVILNWELQRLPDMLRLSIEHAPPTLGWKSLWESASGMESSGEWIHQAALAAGVHRYRLRVQTPNGESVSPVVSVDLTARVFARGKITQVSPNPFNPSTTIRFEIPRAGSTRLAVYDVAGRLIRVLVDQPLAAGEHTRVWRGQDTRGRRVASGAYLLMLETNDQSHVRRAVLLQ